MAEEQQRATNSDCRGEEGRSARKSRNSEVEAGATGQRQQGAARKACAKRSRRGCGRGVRKAESAGPAREAEAAEQRPERRLRGAQSMPRGRLESSGGTPGEGARFVRVSSAEREQKGRGGQSQARNKKNVWRWVGQDGGAG